MDFHHFGLSITQFITLVVIIWALWYARRKAIHEDEFKPPFSTHMFIHRFLSDVNEATTVGLCKGQG
jgi:heme A synthase